METRLTNVAILEDHPLVAESIKARLEKHPVTYCTILPSLSAMATLTFRPAAIDLWIIDLELGNETAWDLITNLRLKCATTGILVYTMHDTPWIRARLDKEGVTLAVSKSDPVEELDLAIEAFFNNKSYFSTSFREAQRPNTTLTQREIDILRLITKGASTAEHSSP